MYTAYLAKGSQSTPYPIAASTILGSNMLNLYNSSVESQCLSDFSRSISNDIAQYAATTGAVPKNYPGVINSAVNTAKIAAILFGNEPGQTKLPGKTLIVQGSADTTVLPAMTNKLLATMQAKGNDVTLSYHNSATATHSGVLYTQAAQLAVMQYLFGLFGSASSGTSSN
jgi:hypothetical protein